MGAPQEQGLSLRSFVEGFGEVDLKNFVGDGMVDPAFFDQGDQERAGFFVSCEAECVEGLGVGVGLDCSGGGEDEDVVCGGVGLRFERDARVARLRSLRFARALRLPGMTITLALA